MVAQDGHNLIESKSNTKEGAITTQNNGDINNYKTASYSSTRFQDGTMVTQGGQDIGTTLAQDGQEFGSTWATLKEYKNKRIKEIKNIDDDIAHVREGDFVEVLEVTEVKKENEQKKSSKESFAELVKVEAAWLAAIQKNTSSPHQRK